VRNSAGKTGAQAAREILDRNGVYDVSVERSLGDLTDHYDPAKKVVRLSERVYDTDSISALSIAAHETGHAIQHREGYAPLSMRSAIFPVCRFGTQAAGPIILIGLLTGFVGLIDVGIVLFMIYALFSVITLPVEFNASGRALAMLEDYNYLSSEEIPSAKKVLSAAALTYVASTLSALLTVLRFMAIRNSRRR
jgi:Zn-dependent membrane protease YugP